MPKMHNKIAVVVPQSLRLCPYVSSYSKVLNEYDLISWDRQNYHEYDRRARNNYLYYDKKYRDGTKSSLIKGYLFFAAFVKRIISAEEYNRIVFFQPLMAILLLPALKKMVEHGNMKILIDVRDYSYENNGLFRLFEKEVFSLSSINVIASPGFKEFLPKNYTYEVYHNLPNTTLLQGNAQRDAKRNNPRVISYIGWINYIDQCEKLIDVFSNDDRFVLRFIGKGSDRLNGYIRKSKASNVFTLGDYRPSEVLQYYMTSDIVANVYGHGNNLLDFALSNKLYMCAYLRKPILVSPETMMATISKELGIGFVMDFDKHGIKDDLMSFLNDFNVEKVEPLCEKFCSECELENQSTISKIKYFSNTLKL